MQPVASLRLYPRPDKEYQKKSSLDFQRILGNLYEKRPIEGMIQLNLWALCFLIGLGMGTLAFLLDILVEEIVDWRWSITENVVQSSGWGMGLITIIGISLPLALIAMLLTAFLAPASAGSGVAETMGILNGVNYPDFITLKCLVVKFFGVALAVSAGLCVGKEGPLVHMGSIVGCAMPYIPLNFARYFRNDFEKRKLMAVGVACGVSAAFGAPIGGALFAYEISKPNTFWSFSLTWKVFFASTIATFSLSAFK